MGQKLKSRPYSITSSANREQQGRHVEPERLGAPQVHESLAVPFGHVSTANFMLFLTALPELPDPHRLLIAADRHFAKRNRVRAILAERVPHRG